MSIIQPKLAGAVLMVMVSASASGQAVKSPSQRASATSAVSEAKKVFDDKLLDYRATRFRAVRYVRVGGRWNAFCGEINTTNRMRGFIGWRAFLLPVGDEAADSLYDKPTIEGQPTSIGTLINQFGPKKIEGDPASRLIAGTCGDEAVRVDQTDYAASLTFKP